MSETFAELLVKFSSSGGAKVDGELKKVETSAGRAGRATDGFMKSLAALGIVAGTISIGKEIIDTTREFEKLEAGLITSTGSAENAAKAFDALKEFAATTPYDLKQTTTAFTQLVNLGLDPGERAMKAYGNTAAAMNKDLSQMVEAVADAATGEYERLKEFGIKAKSEGDKVTFTFRGMSETVKNNSQSIQDYLIKLGETNFSDAMANRMKTLDGAISNLGDSWDQLKNNIGKSGLSDVVQTEVRRATSNLDELSMWLESGAVGDALDAMKEEFKRWGSDIETTMNLFDDLFDTTYMDSWAKDITLRILPSIRASVALLTVEAAANFDKLALVMKTMSEGLNGPAAAVRTVFESKDILSRGFASIDKAKDSQFDEIIDEYTKSANKVNAGFESAAQKIKDAKAEKASLVGPKRVFEDSGNDALKQDTDPRNYKDNTAYGLQLTSNYGDLLYKDSKRLERRERAFGVSATSGLSRFAASGGKSGADNDTKATDKSKREFESLMESLRTEEEAINDSYKKRNELILKNTEQGSTLRADLEKRSREKYEEDKKQLLESASNDELGKLVEQLRTEEERIEDSYKKRLEIIRSSTKEESSIRKDLEARAKDQHDKEKKALEDRNQHEIDMLKNSVMTESEAMDYKYGSLKEKILESTKLTEEEKNSLIEKLNTARRQEEEDRENEHYTKLFSGTEQFFGALAGAAQTFGGKQSAMYKALFVTQKAFALASSLLQIQKAMADALGDPTKVTVEQKFLGMSEVAAAGAGIISTLTSIAAFDTGGIIPPGKFGLVGEVGPEFVKGPAFVTSRRSTADKLKNQVPTVNIHNYAGVEVETKTKQGISGQELEIIIKRVAQQTEASIASGIARGEGAVTKTLENAYSIRRGRN